MGFGTAATTTRTVATTVALLLLAACTTYVPLATDVRDADALPTDTAEGGVPLERLPMLVTDDAEEREHAHFVVRELSVPSPVDPAESIAFEYYDVDGDERTPVVVLLPIFNGQLAIPRFFARYFANQGWAAVVVVRGRDPLAAIAAPEAMVQSNLKDYRRVLDWIEQEPELDVSRIGVFGVSLGAMDAVMLAALDERVNALVIAMAGGDLPYLLLNTNYRRVVRSINDIAASQGTSREALGARLDADIKTDPLTLARYIDPERVFMIITRTDAIIPFEAQQELRASLGSPETLYLITGHRPSVVFFPKVRSAAFEFFTRRFAEQHVALAMN